MATGHFIENRYQLPNFVLKDSSKLSKDDVVLLLNHILDRQKHITEEESFKFRIYTTKKGEHQAVYPKIGPADHAREGPKSKTTGTKPHKSLQKEQDPGNQKTGHFPSETSVAQQKGKPTRRSGKNRQQASAACLSEDDVEENVEDTILEKIHAEKGKKGRGKQKSGKGRKELPAGMTSSADGRKIKGKRVTEGRVTCQSEKL